MADQKQADKKFKKGKQNITISIFNWNKDYATASSDFDQAYKIYSKIGKWDKCITTLRELIQCNEKNMDNWAVARNYQSIVDIIINNFPQANIQSLKKDATQGFISFRLAQSVDKGLSMISRVTKYLIKRQKLEQGIQLLHQAYKISLEDEKSFKKGQIFNQIIQTYLDNGIYAEAQKLYMEQISNRSGVDCDQLGLIVLLLMIIQGEIKRAEKALYQLADRIPTFLSSNDCQVADNLIKFYKQGNVEGFKKQTTKAAVTTIFPIIIIRKLREVIVPSAESFVNANEDQKQKILNEILF